MDIALEKINWARIEASGLRGEQEKERGKRTGQQEVERLVCEVCLIL